MCNDPGTYTGASVAGMNYPVPWGLLPAVYALSGGDYPKPFKEPEPEKPDEDEIRRAQSHLSPMFRTLMTEQ
ncbi:hypothetical protein BPY_00010 [Bifidobacterium psychraerophilum]